jgi:hypothetical protein
MNEFFADFWRYRSERPRTHRDVALSCTLFGCFAAISAALATLGFDRWILGSGDPMWPFFAIWNTPWSAFWVFKILVRINLHWPTIEAEARP